MNAEKRTIVFALMSGDENIHSCQTLAQVLQKKGYKVVFIIDEITKERIKSTGFEDYVFGTESDSLNSRELDLNCLNSEAIERVKGFSYHLIAKQFEVMKRNEDLIQQLVERIKPHLIIVESMVCSPALTNSGIPWVWLNFGPPNIYKNDSRLPPGWSGLSINKPNDWKVFNNEWNSIFDELKQQMNDWCKSRGAPELPPKIFHPSSPHLNFYVYPKVLDYKIGNTWEQKSWTQFDCLLSRRPLKKFEIPGHLRSKSAKLIYLSMGSFASLDLMKRLTTQLADSEHRFIVSKGPFHNEYELPNNMWGLEDIPLNDVIADIDLIITNGNNDSVFESFFYAKPLIILPLFGQQLDNRIRFREMGFGWGLEPFTCTKETLLMMINNMIDDKPLARRLYTSANSMNNLDVPKEMVAQIEKLLNPKTDELTHVIPIKKSWKNPANDSTRIVETEA